MIPMMTQNLGQRPGDARLGAVARCAHPVASHPALAAHRAGNWRLAASIPATGGFAGVANAGYMGTTTTGLRFRSTKRTARLLGTRST